jgi:hypothetical protein
VYLKAVDCDKKARQMAGSGVLDCLKEVAEGIEHIRKIAEAVRDGEEYLKQAHPEIRADLAALCNELTKTTLTVAAASGLLTHFRFTISGGGVDLEPARFNEHLVRYGGKAALLEMTLNSMRGQCNVIKKHADRLRKRAKSRGLNLLLLVFGIDSCAQENELAESLCRLHEDDILGYTLVQRLSHALRHSLEEVSRELGENGTMSPNNVPKAAKVLGRYADSFSKLESECNYLTLELRQSIQQLQNS